MLAAIRQYERKPRWIYLHVASDALQHHLLHPEQESLQDQG